MLSLKIKTLKKNTNKFPQFILVAKIHDKLLLI